MYLPLASPDGNFDNNITFRTGFMMYERHKGVQQQQQQKARVPNQLWCGRFLFSSMVFNKFYIIVHYTKYLEHRFDSHILLHGLT